MGEYVNKYFHSKFNRDFLFSNECLSNEIKEHFLGYLYCLNYKVTMGPVLGTYYYATVTQYANDLQLWAKGRASFMGACQAANIHESDAVNNLMESVGFNYFSGIRSYYKKTNKDPFYINGKRKFVKDNDTWLNYVSLE